MKTLDAFFEAHITGEVTTLAVCWKITKKNGEIIRGTSHDADITIDNPGSPDHGLAGTYVAAANITASDAKTGGDLSVDNMEIQGGFQIDFSIPDVTASDIESGVLTNAEVRVFLVNWRSPNGGRPVTEARGYLGDIVRDSDGQYKTEIRGPQQLLSQNIGQNMSERCNVIEFGDARCGKDITGLIRVGAVTAVTSNRQFQITFISAPPSTADGYYDGAKVLFTSGENNGFKLQVKSATIAGSVLTVDLYEAAPLDIIVGDTVSVPPACNRVLATCRDVHDNVFNFKGAGVFVPGALALMKGNL